MSNNAVCSSSLRGSYPRRISRDILNTDRRCLDIFSNPRFYCFQSHALIDDRVIISDDIVIDHCAIRVNIPPSSSINGVAIHTITMKPTER
jgi:hypothetical protein